MLSRLLASKSSKTPLFGTADEHAAIGRLRRLATLLDSAVRIPGTEVKVGVDAIIGFVPGIGDAFAALFSTYILISSARIGASRPLLLRMFGNSLLDLLIGAIPVVGDIFDIAWKSNSRNIDLLERAVAERRIQERSVEETGKAFIFLGIAILFFGIFLAVMIGAGLFWLIFKSFNS